MSVAKRIIPCLDVKNGRVVKGVNFVGLRDAGVHGAARDNRGGLVQRHPVAHAHLSWAQRLQHYARFLAEGGALLPCSNLRVTVGLPRCWRIFVLRRASIWLSTQVH